MTYSHRLIPDKAYRCRGLATTFHKPYGAGVITNSECSIQTNLQVEFSENKAADATPHALPYSLLTASTPYQIAN
jgi:hypothetical protein